jgi:hypothetical protein
MQLPVPVLLALYCAPSFSTSTFPQRRNGQSVPSDPPVGYDNEESLPAPHSIAETVSYKNGYLHFMNISLGGSRHFLQVDTTSGSLWVLQWNTRYGNCPNTSVEDKEISGLGGATLELGSCGMGVEFHGTYGPGSDHFMTYYTDKSTVFGSLGVSDVKVAGLSLADVWVSAPLP